MIKIKIVIIIIFFLIASCAHNPIISSVQEKDVLSKIEYQIDLTDANFIKNEIEVAKNLINKRHLSDDEFLRLERIIYIYHSAARLDEQAVLIPPHSSVTVDLLSFCLDPSLSSPSKSETFVWKMGEPDIPYYRTLLKEAAKGDQNYFQELIWNLEENIEFKKFPLKAQSILKAIDPEVESVLYKRRIKESAINAVKESAKEIVGGRVSDEYSFYEDFASQLTKRAATNVVNGQELVQLNELDSVFVRNDGDSFLSQRPKFYNVGEIVKRINVLDYHLVPLRSNVQRIGIYARSNNKISDLILQALKDAIVRYSKYWYSSKMNSKELSLVEKYPLEALSVFIQSQKAIISTRKYFIFNKADDESDAFRHFVWAGLSTQNVGEDMARRFLNAHEFMTSKPSDKERDSSKMDLNNNEIGIKTAIELQNKNELNWFKLEKIGIDKVQDKTLTVLKSGSKIIYPH